jgi:hypothetical protein
MSKCQRTCSLSILALSDVARPVVRPRVPSTTSGELNMNARGQFVYWLVVTQPVCVYNRTRSEYTTL